MEEQTNGAFKLRDRCGSKIGGCDMDSVTHWPWVRRYAPTETHVQRTQSSLSITEVPARASLGPSSSIETGHGAVIVAALEGGSPENG